MGKSSLTILSLAVTLLSLITVDSRIPDIDNSNIVEIPTVVLHLKYHIDIDASLLTNVTNKRILNHHYLNTFLIYNESSFNQKLINCAQVLGQLLIFIYCCLGIGALCDEHFIPSLELIGKSFSLSSDITAAILIPLGTSGPEIFSSAVGVFFADNDIGTGSIIGSSIYNLLAIPAVCGFSAFYFTGKSIKLEASFIVKDLLLYIVAIIGLIFTIKDQNVDIIEASLLMALFAIFIGIKVLSSRKDPEQDSIDDNNNCIKKAENIILNDDITSENDEDDEEDDDDNEDGLMGNKYLRCLLMPLLTLFQITIPPNIPSLSCIISMTWLSGLSYISVWAITGTSESLAIPATIAGMTILAAGSAVPDLVTSVVVMRRAIHASMGISTAISANIFAVLFGLGFPWLLKCTFNQIVKGQSEFAIESAALPFTSILLLIAIFVVMFSFMKCNWELGKAMAIVCGVLQLIFTVIAIVAEFMVN